MTLLDEQLQRVGVEALALTSSSSDEDVRVFMMDVLELGLLLEAEPSTPRGLRRLLDETAPHLDDQFVLIGSFVSLTRIHAMTGWSDDPSPWSELCARRSAIEFFAELYRDSSLSPRLEALDQPGLDQLMRSHAHHADVAPDEIPDHMPTRHWWWWLPDAPPS